MDDHQHLLHRLPIADAHHPHVLRVQEPSPAEPLEGTYNGLYIEVGLGDGKRAEWCVDKEFLGLADIQNHNFWYAL
jgi:hypothetical protein